MPTVRDVTFNLLRRLGLTTIVGNPGSTEETFLRDLPDDFKLLLSKIGFFSDSKRRGQASDDSLAACLKLSKPLILHTG